MLDQKRRKNRRYFMKKYEKPSIQSLAMSSLEETSAFSKFDSLENFGTTTDSVNSFTWSSGLGYED